MNFFALAIGTGAINQSVSAGVPAAALAVIAACAGQKLVPAVFAQIRIGFTNTPFAVYADRWPKQLIQTL